MRLENFIRWYYMYQRIWNPELGEVTVAVLEDDNTNDCYAVTKVPDLRISSLASFSIERSLTLYNYVSYSAILLLLCWKMIIPTIAML